MAIIRCPACGRASRIQESDSTDNCPHCQAQLAGQSSKSLKLPAADTPPISPPSSARAESVSGSSADLRTDTPGPAFPTIAGPPPKPPSFDWCPPKFPNATIFHRFLPPRFPMAPSLTPFSQRKGVIRIPDGAGGFREIDERIVHVDANGEKIPIAMADRRTQWRQRALFNLIAMLVCLAILYLSFVFMIPRR